MISGLMRVFVYSDRIVLRVLFIGSRTIMADEITSISTDGTLAFGARVLTIDHESPEVRSPVVLALRENHPVRAAIRTLPRPEPGVGASAVPAEGGGWSVLTIGQVAVGLVIVGVGVYFMVRQPSIFLLLWLGIGVLVTVQAMARARHGQRHRSSR
jgi:hypothetical protein